MIHHIKVALNEAAKVLSNLSGNSEALDSIQMAAHGFAAAFSSGNRVFSCGNGGSMCDAMHFSEELSGKFRKPRAGLAAIAISDPGHISCIANDFGYEEIFSRYLESHARKGDALLAISTSGKSPNICKAAKTAQKKSVLVVALTGTSGSPLSRLTDIEICTPGGGFADRSQELHIKVIHILIELIERQLFPHNY
jgi:D-sedoheptulose 7-phosphate isomerase